MVDRTTHTPGPWKATRSEPIDGCDLWWITACPASNKEKEVGSVIGGCAPHAEANARLIAAAPELLAMLVEVTARLAGNVFYAPDPVCECDDCTTGRIVIQSRALIARIDAEGKV